MKQSRYYSSAEYRTLIPSKQNQRCGRPEPKSEPLRKGLLNAALDAWIARNGGNCPIRAAMLWPKQRRAI